MHKFLLKIVFKYGDSISLNTSDIIGDKTIESFETLNELKFYVDTLLLKRFLTYSSKPSNKLIMITIDEIEEVIIERDYIMEEFPF